MKIRKILIILAAVILISAHNHSFSAETKAQDYSGEVVQYLISPLGRSEYKNHGLVDLNGVKVNLVTFKTNVIFFDDTELIYSDPKTLLPIRVERHISEFLGSEYITEEYDQEKFTVVTKKFAGKKIIQEQVVQANGPIYNAITLPFFLRRQPDLEIGMRFTARVPDEFEVELASIEEITVPAGKFRAYHFKSIPDKFEVWISQDDFQVPLKIQGKGFFDYALVMKEYKRGQ